MSHAEQRALSLDVRSILREGIARLRAARVSSDTLAAEVLLLFSLGRDRSWLYSHADEQLDPYVVANYFTFIARRVAGEPTQYLTGKQEFWGLEFEVTPAVLIPRPETEHVVEVALERLGAAGIKVDMKTGAPSPRLRIADVGTGSGCIAIALAHELPHAEIFATDISAAALHVARGNGARHRVADRVHFVETDLLQGIFLSPLATARSPQLFDLIVSNPPYVARDDAATLEREVREHEPRDCALWRADGYRNLCAADRAGRRAAAAGRESRARAWLWRGGFCPRDSFRATGLGEYLCHERPRGDSARYRRGANLTR